MAPGSAHETDKKDEIPQKKGLRKVQWKHLIFKTEVNYKVYFKKKVEKVIQKLKWLMELMLKMPLLIIK